MFQDSQIFEVMGLFWPIFKFFFELWWIWLPSLLFLFFSQFWLSYARMKWATDLQWVLLEVRPPKNIEKTPKVMEHAFSGFWAIYGNVGGFMDKWINGATQFRFSLEIVGDGGNARFYIKIPAAFRNLAEAHLYAQYPQAEINVVEDYTQEFSSQLLKNGWDVWGTVLGLAKPDAYPIKTYAQIGDSGGSSIDPLSSMMEVFGKLGEGEKMMVQIVCRPAADEEWKNAGKAMIDELSGKKPETKFPLPVRIVLGAINAIIYVAETIISGKAPAPAEKKEAPTVAPSPSSTKAIGAIQESITKKGFQTTVRLMYLGRNDVFNKANVGALMGVFHQFASLDLNSFKPDKRYSTGANWPFKDLKTFMKKSSMISSYRSRAMSANPYILNLEELATLYHFPMVSVEAPSAPKIDAKKATAPPNLPMM